MSGQWEERLEEFLVPSRLLKALPNSGDPRNMAERVGAIIANCEHLAELVTPEPKLRKFTEGYLKQLLDARAIEQSTPPPPDTQKTGTDTRMEPPAPWLDPPSQIVPVVTRGLSCRYRHANEFGVFIETCCRDAVSLIGGKNYCADHAAKIMAAKDMVGKHAARIGAADDRVKQEKGG